MQILPKIIWCLCSFKILLYICIFTALNSQYSTISLWMMSWYHHHGLLWLTNKPLGHLNISDRRPSCWCHASRYQMWHKVSPPSCSDNWKQQLRLKATEVPLNLSIFFSFLFFIIFLFFPFLLWWDICNLLLPYSFSSSIFIMTWWCLGQIWLEINIQCFHKKFGGQWIDTGEFHWNLNLRPISLLWYLNLNLGPNLIICWGERQHAQKVCAGLLLSWICGVTKKPANDIFSYFHSSTTEHDFNRGWNDWKLILVGSFTNLDGSFRSLELYLNPNQNLNSNLINYWDTQIWLTIWLP